MTLNLEGTFALQTAGFDENETSINANGGTELVKRGLYQRLDPELRDKVQVICTRVRDVDPTRPTILWQHDMPNDPENSHLAAAESLDRFAQLVFVSGWQQTMFNVAYQIPFSKCSIVPNAIEPFARDEIKNKSTEQIQFIYHTTPHRGLHIAYAVFDKLYQEYGDYIHFDVFSSFSVYGQEQRDEQYREVFDACEAHEGITYHGGVSNDHVRDALKEAHVFLYPSIWPETSCIAAIEAMSAGCFIIAPKYGALSETLINQWTYDWHEDQDFHAGRSYQRARAYVEMMKQDTWTYDSSVNELTKINIDLKHSWDAVLPQWESIFRRVLHEN